MTQPSDLLIHYSNKAFQTRIYALTFVGTSIGAYVNWGPKDGSQNNIFGLGLIIVVFSLAELNRRYTHSYTSALIASVNSASYKTWGKFKFFNEYPYKHIYTYKGIKWKVFSRFLLSWLTYIPGLLAGLYFILPFEFNDKFDICGISISLIALMWWSYDSWESTNRFENIKSKWKLKNKPKTNEDQIKTI